jgi:hypothetical protein
MTLRASLATTQPKNAPGVARANGIATSTGLVAGLAAVVLATAVAVDEPRSGGGLSGSEAACASLMVVMNPEGTAFDIVSVQALSDWGMRFVYTATAPGRAPLRRTLACGFGGAGELLAVRVDGVPLGPARLALLERFWLGSGAAAIADLPAIPPRRIPPAAAPDWLTSSRPASRSDR